MSKLLVLVIIHSKTLLTSEVVKRQLTMGGAYGGSLGFGIKGGVDLELYYSRQESTLSAFSSSDNVNFREPGNVSYWMLGGVKNFQAFNPNLSFFTAFRFGGMTFSTKDNKPDSVSKFAASLGGGLKSFLSDQMGIKISRNRLFPIFDSGATLWFGSGGVGAGATFWSPVLQLNASVGIFYKLNL